MKCFAILSVAICSVFSSSMAKAELINVDCGTGVGTYQGAAMTGAARDTWNAVSATSGTSLLVDAAGNSSGVTMTLGGAIMLNSYNGSDAPFYSTSYRALMCDVAYTSTTMTFTLTGLTASQKYDLYVYSGAVNLDRAGTFTATTSVNSASVTLTDPLSAGSTFMQGKNYGVLEVTIGSDQTLTLTCTKVGSSTANLAGFQLLAVPEPTSMALTSIGAISVLAYAWRKRRKTSDL